MYPLALLFLTSLPLMAVLPVFGQTVSHKEIEEVLITMEQTALGLSDLDQPGSFLHISDPDVVYIDPLLEQPLHGLDSLTKYYKSFPTEPTVPGKMANARVQVSGDVAVLTFNYYTTRNWNATEVYRRTETGWRIIHTHWSYLKP